MNPSIAAYRTDIRVGAAAGTCTTRAEGLKCTLRKYRPGKLWRSIGAFSEFVPFQPLVESLGNRFWYESPGKSLYMLVRNLSASALKANLTHITRNP